MKLLRFLLLCLSLCSVSVALAEDRKKAQQKLEAGAKSYNAGDYQEALAHYLEAIKAAPSAAGPYRELGKTYDALGDFKSAKTSYEEYLKKRPDAPDAATIKARLAEMSASGEDRVKAQAALEAGASAYNQGNYREARRQYQLAIQAAPTAAGPYRELGKTYDALGEYRDAKASYEEYLRRRPDAQDTETIRARLDELNSLVKEKGDKNLPRATQDPFDLTPTRDASEPRLPRAAGVALIGAVVLGGIAAGFLLANQAGDNLIIGQ
jgi:tetratricopeptide (TPR) repeat protein